MLHHVVGGHRREPKAAHLLGLTRSDRGDVAGQLPRNIMRNADFRRLFLASVISLGGDWFLFVALGGLVLEVTGEAFAVGVLIMAQELPVFLATPWAGWLADRFDRRRLMIACDIARTALCIS